LRILGIDLGEKKIGLAISDELGITAQGLPTILSSTEQENLARIKEIVERYRVVQIVLGLPRNMNGTLGKEAEKAMSFAKNLNNLCRIPVELEDERLSTAAAEKFLIAVDRSRKKRKKVIDKMSAVLILQSYLDRRMMSNG